MIGTGQCSRLHDCTRVNESRNAMNGGTRSPVKVYVMLDQSLGQVRLDPSRPAQPMVGADLYPSAATAVQELSELGYEVDVLAPQVDQPEITVALSRAMPG